MAYIINNSFPDELLSERDVNWQYGNGDPEHGVVLHWTTEPPTVEGWYWMMQPSGVPLCLYFDGRLGIEDEYLDFDDFTHWLGPLPPPEPPQ